MNAPLNKLLRLGLILSLSTLGQVHANGKENIKGKPNIVFIMADDLGYGDLACYGSLINRTPNIDFLAKNGIKFTDFHSNGPMCSPTRAALMTGMYQHRFGEKFESALSDSDPNVGLPLSALTIAEVLKKAGYTTGMYGKWHLGYKPPLFPSNQGFDDFIGLGSGDGDHHTHIDRAGNKDWWHNDQLKMEEGYSTDLITNHSIDFIKKNAKKPFFLYVSLLAVHFPWEGPNDPPHRKEGVNHDQDKWGIIPDRKNVRPHIKAMVESMDDGIGKIIKTLKDLKLQENTLVIFTSDNGGYIDYKTGGFENISSNGPLRGQKTDIYEGGHRVPAIAYWPGKIKPGLVNDEMVMTMDMYPTFSKLAGASYPDNLHPDGINILPLLLENQKLPDRNLYWKIRNKRALRKKEWKLCLIDKNPPELFNLSEDIGETNNVSSRHPDLVKSLLAEYNSWERDITANYQK
jgi:arylsulfatase A